MITVHFYDEKTGEIARKVFRTTASNAAEIIALNTPAGHRPIAGVTDWKSQRVDLRTGLLVVDADLAQRNRALRELAQRLNELTEERDSLEKLQVRSLSELAADANNAQARQHFNRRKARLDELRALINAEMDTSAVPSR